MPNKLALVALTLAAILEVWGDRTIGNGFKHDRHWLVFGGCLLLALYGIAVNSYNAYVTKAAPSPGHAPWEFSRLLGLYVVFFAVTAVIWSAAADPVKPSKATYWGVGVILVGGAIIHVGNR